MRGNLDVVLLFFLFSTNPPEDNFDLFPVGPSDMVGPVDRLSFLGGTALSSSAL